MNYVRINLTKDTQDLDTENYKHCREKVKKSWINGKIFGIHEFEDSVLRCLFFKIIPLKIPGLDTGRNF